MQYLSNLGRLHAAIEANPYKSKTEHADDLGLSTGTISNLWKKLRADYEAQLVEDEKQPEK